MPWNAPAPPGAPAELLPDALIAATMASQTSPKVSRAVAPGAHPAPARLPMAFAAPVVTTQGDGSLLVKPGRPVQWINAEQIAAHFGIDRSTVYRAAKEGFIPEAMIQPVGKRKLLFAAAVIEHLAATWRARWENR